MNHPDFEWDESKNIENKKKHGVSFYEAQYAFLDPKRLIAENVAHSEKEKRYFCFGVDKDRKGVLTIRFTYCSGKIRIFGAGYWRKGRKIYEQRNSIHR